MIFKSIEFSYWCYKITKKKKLSWCLIDWQLSVPNVNGHAYSYPLPRLWRWGLNLDLNSIQRVIIHLSVPEIYNFDTIIIDQFYRSSFTTLPNLMGARGAHKLHQGYIYSYHWVQNLYQLFDCLILFLHVSPSNSRPPYRC